MTLAPEFQEKLKEVQEGVRRALHRFFEKDGKLLYLDANERSITHKIAEHLQCEFQGYDVDCEYNRRDGSKKTLPRRIKITCIKSDDLDANTVYPDIILHKRGTECNRLVIEAKKSKIRHDIDNHYIDNDRQKLKGFTSPSYRYQYEFGLLLFLNADGRSACEDCRFEWYHKGEKI